MANCFREISELEGTAQREDAVRGGGEEMLINPPVHSSVNISPSQACREMNIKHSFVCLLEFNVMVFFVTYAMLGKRVELMLLITPSPDG